jgi:hypothetical protein
MSKQQPVTSTFHNSTCKNVGHEWKPSLSQTYRTCTRAHCKAAERLINGAWINAARPSHTRKPQPASSSCTLWSMPRYDYLSANQPYPGYSATEERRAEQRYYKAVADEQYYRLSKGTGGISCR